MALLLQFEYTIVLCLSTSTPSSPSCRLHIPPKLTKPANQCTGPKNASALLQGLCNHGVRKHSTCAYGSHHFPLKHPTVRGSAKIFVSIWHGCRRNRLVSYGIRRRYQLARVTASTFTECDPALNRYFDPTVFTFVRNVFETIANFPLNSETNSPNVMQILRSGPVGDLSPKFQSLMIAYDTPLWTPDSAKGYCSSQEAAAYIFDAYTTNPTIVVCPVALLNPKAADIFDPPAWARNSQGQPFPGYGCDGLGDHDSGWVRFPGADVLHELIHWGESISRDPTAQGDGLILGKSLHRR